MIITASVDPLPGKITCQCGDVFDPASCIQGQVGADYMIAWNDPGWEYRGRLIYVPDLCNACETERKKSIDAREKESQQTTLESVMEINWRNSGLSSIHQDWTWEKFEPVGTHIDHEGASLQDKIDHLRNIDLRRSRHGIILASTKTGVGKTRIAINILRHYLDKIYAGMFLPYPRLMAAIDSEGRMKQDTLNRAMTTPILILDDLAQTHPKNRFGVVTSRVVNLLDERFNSGRPTIITTNATHQTIKEIFGEHFGRIMLEFATEPDGSRNVIQFDQFPTYIAEGRWS